MRVNRSVWWEEVDQALYDFIKENVFYKRGGKEIPVPIHFYPIKDEHLIKSGLRPGVAIQHLVEKFDTDRYSSEEVVTATIDNVAHIEQSAKPYTLQYQIEFISDLQTDVNYMTRCWHSATGMRFMLPVKDAEGTQRYSYVYTNRQAKTYVTVETEDRLIRDIIQINVKVELDEGIVRQGAIVTTPPIISFN